MNKITVIIQTGLIVASDNIINSYLEQQDIGLKVSPQRLFDMLEGLREATRHVLMTVEEQEEVYDHITSKLKIAFEEHLHD